jgi:hypothetical protein
VPAVGFPYRQTRGRHVGSSSSWRRVVSRRSPVDRTRYGHDARIGDERASPILRAWRRRCRGGLGAACAGLAHPQGSRARVGLTVPARTRGAPSIRRATCAEASGIPWFCTVASRTFPAGLQASCSLARSSKRSYVSDDRIQRCGQSPNQSAGECRSLGDGTRGCRSPAAQRVAFARIRRISGWR